LSFIKKGALLSKEGLVRLNVDVPKELWRRAKQRALDLDTDLRTVVIEALEATLSRPSKKGGKA
jgi:hypothetical protein